MIFLTPGEPSGAMFMPAQQNVAKKLRKSNKTWRFGSNTKIGLKSVYISQTGTYTFQMQPGTLALVVTYYGIYPHYCTGNGQITANQLVIQDGENTITSVNGNTVSVYNRYDRNNMAQAIIFFIEPN